MEHIYLYDGSFDGLLTVYFDAFRDPAAGAICRSADYALSLFARPVEVATDADKALRVDRAVARKLSPDTLRRLYLLYLSELPECDWLGLRYLRLCFAEGARIQLAEQHPIIRQVEDYRCKVLRELDRVKGFLRFQELAPLTFYARFAPDHNQLPLLLPHLQRRFSDQRMLVHDVKRRTALLCTPARSEILPFTEHDAELLLQTSADGTADLFRQYFQAVNIPQRANPRLQDCLMPRRYRQYMPETQQAAAAEAQSRR